VTSFKLRITGIAVGDGSFNITGPHINRNGVFAAFKARQDQMTVVEVGPFTIEEGATKLECALYPTVGQPPFFVGSFELVPVTSN